jgi:hypothetical protein
MTVIIGGDSWSWPVAILNGRIKYANGPSVYVPLQVTPNLTVIIADSMRFMRGGAVEKETGSFDGTSA